MGEAITHISGEAPASEPAFRELYEAHYRAILAYCRRRANAADSQDATSEVFEIAWRRFHDIPTGEATRPWLYGVAYRVLSHQWRGARRRRRLSDKLQNVRKLPRPSPDTQVVEHHDYDLVRAAAARLAPLDQEVLRLVMWEELSHEQVATMIGSTAAAAKQRFHRAKGRLAREFKKLGGTIHPIAQEEGES